MKATVVLLEVVLVQARKPPALTKPGLQGVQERLLEQVVQRREQGRAEDDADPAA
jgi:hypothetical protein